jgi:hypothetical protein
MWGTGGSLAPKLPPPVGGRPVCQVRIFLALHVPSQSGRCHENTDVDLGQALCLALQSEAFNTFYVFRNQQQACRV